MARNRRGGPRPQPNQALCVSWRASRLRGEIPAQHSPRRREERKGFREEKPFQDAKNFRLDSIGDTKTPRFLPKDHARLALLDSFCGFPYSRASESGP